MNFKFHGARDTFAFWWGKIVKTDTVDRFMAAAGERAELRFTLAGDADLDTILSYLSQQEVTVLEAGN